MPLTSHVSADTREVEAGLRKNKIKSLNLRYLPAGLESLVQVANALCDNQSLEQLNLSSLVLGRKGCEILSKAFLAGAVRELRSLNVSACDLGDEGALLLVNALAASPCGKTLSVLVMERNGLTDRSGRDLAKWSVAQRISRLDLKCNRLGDDTAAAFAEVLKDRHNTLVHLDLFNNCVGPRGSAALAQAVAASESVLSLHIECNLLSGDRNAEFIKERCKRNMKTLSSKAEIMMAEQKVGHAKRQLFSSNDNRKQPSIAASSPTISESFLTDSDRVPSEASESPNTVSVSQHAASRSNNIASDIFSASAVSEWATRVDMELEELRAQMAEHARERPRFVDESRQHLHDTLAKIEQAWQRKLDHYKGRYEKEKAARETVEATVAAGGIFEGEGRRELKAKKNEVASLRRELEQSALRFTQTNTELVSLKESQPRVKASLLRCATLLGSRSALSRSFCAWKAGHGMRRSQRMENEIGRAKADLAKAKGVIQGLEDLTSNLRKTNESLLTTLASRESDMSAQRARIGRLERQMRSQDKVFARVISQNKKSRAFMLWKTNLKQGSILKESMSMQRKLQVFEEEARGLKVYQGGLEEQVSHLNEVLRQVTADKEATAAQAKQMRDQYREQVYKLREQLTEAVSSHEVERSTMEQQHLKALAHEQNRATIAVAAGERNIRIYVARIGHLRGQLSVAQAWSAWAQYVTASRACGQVEHFRKAVNGVLGNDAMSASSVEKEATLLKRHVEALEQRVVHLTEAREDEIRSRIAAEETGATHLDNLLKALEEVKELKNAVTNCSANASAANTCRHRAVGVIANLHKRAAMKTCFTTWQGWHSHAARVNNVVRICLRRHSRLSHTLRLWQRRTHVKKIDEVRLKAEATTLRAVEEAVTPMRMALVEKMDESRAIEEQVAELLQLDQKHKEMLARLESKAASLERERNLALDDLESTRGESARAMEAKGAMYEKKIGELVDAQRSLEGALQEEAAAKRSVDEKAARLEEELNDNRDQLVTLSREVEEVKGNLVSVENEKVVAFERVKELETELDQLQDETQQSTSNHDEEMSKLVEENLSLTSANQMLVAGVEDLEEKLSLLEKDKQRVCEERDGVLADSRDKDSAISSLKDEINTLSSSLRHAEQGLEKSHRAMEEMEQVSNWSRNEISVITSDLDEARIGAKLAHERAEQLSHANEMQQQRIAHLESDVNELQKHIEKAEAEGDEVIARLAQMTSHRDSVKARLDEMTEKFQKERDAVTAMSAANSTLKDELAHAEAKVTCAQEDASRLRVAEGRVRSQEACISELESEAERSSQEIMRLSNSNSRLQETVKDINNALDKLTDENEGLRKRLDEATLSARDLQKERDIERVRANTLDADKTMLEKRLRLSSATTKENAENHEEDMKDLHAKLNKAQRDVASCKQAQRKMETLVDGLLMCLHRVERELNREQLLSAWTKFRLNAERSRRENRLPLGVARVLAQRRCGNALRHWKSCTNANIVTRTLQVMDQEFLIVQRREALLYGFHSWCRHVQVDVEARLSGKIRLVIQELEALQEREASALVKLNGIECILDDDAADEDYIRGESANLNARVNRLAHLLECSNQVVASLRSENGELKARLEQEQQCSGRLSQRLEAVEMEHWSELSSQLQSSIGRVNHLEDVCDRLSLQLLGQQRRARLYTAIQAWESCLLVSRAHKRGAVAVYAAKTRSSLARALTHWHEVAHESSSWKQSAAARRLMFSMRTAWMLWLRMVASSRRERLGHAEVAVETIPKLEAEIATLQCSLQHAEETVSQRTEELHTLNEATVSAAARVDSVQNTLQSLLEEEREKSVALEKTIEAMESDAQDTQERLTDLNDELDINHVHLKEMLSQNDELEARIEELQHSSDSARSALRSVEQEKLAVLERMSALENEVTELKVGMESVCKHSKDIEQTGVATVTDVTSQLENANDTLSALVGRYESVLYAKERALHCAEAARTEADDEVRRLIKQANDLESELAEARNTVEDLTKERESLLAAKVTVAAHYDDDISALRKEIQTLQDENDRLHGDVSDSNMETHTLAEAKVNSERQAAELQQKLEESSEQIGKLGNSLAKSEEAIKLLEAEGERYLTELNEKDTMINELHNELIAAQEETIAVHTELQHAAAAMTELQAAYDIEQQRSASFQDISTRKDSALEEADKLMRAAGEREAEMAESAQKLSAQLEALQEELSETKESADKGLIELEEAKVKMEKMEVERGSAREAGAKATRLQQELSDTKALLDIRGKELDEALTKTAQLQGSVENLENQVNASMVAQQASESRMKELAAQNADILTTGEEHAKKVTVLQEQMENAEEKIRKIIDEREEARAEQARAEERLAHAVSEWDRAVADGENKEASMKETLESLRADLTRVEADKVSISEQLATLRSTMRAEEGQLSNEKQLLEVQLKEMEEVLHSRDEEMATLRQEKDEAQEALSMHQVALGISEQEVDKLQLRMCLSEWSAKACVSRLERRRRVMDALDSWKVYVHQSKMLSLARMYKDSLVVANTSDSLRRAMNHWRLICMAVTCAQSQDTSAMLTVENAQLNDKLGTLTHELESTRDVSDSARTELEKDIARLEDQAEQWHRQYVETSSELVEKERMFSALTSDREILSERYEALKSTVNCLQKDLDEERKISEERGRQAEDESAALTQLKKRFATSQGDAVKLEEEVEQLKKQCEAYREHVESVSEAYNKEKEWRAKEGTEKEVLEGRVAALEEQLEAADSSHELGMLRDELKEERTLTNRLRSEVSDLQSYSDEMTLLKTKLAESENRAQESVKQNEEYAQRLYSLNADREHALAAAAASEESLKAELEKADESFTALRAEADIQAECIKSLKAENSSLASEVSTLASKLHHLQEDKEDSSIEHSKKMFSLKKELSTVQLDLEHARIECDELRNACDQKDAELEDALLHKQARNSEIAQTEDRFVSLQKDFTEAQNRAAEAEKALQEFTGEYSTLVQANETMSKELDNLQKKMCDVKRQMTLEAEERELLLESNNTLQRELEDLVCKAEVLEGALENAEAEFMTESTRKPAPNPSLRNSASSLSGSQGRSQLFEDLKSKYMALLEKGQALQAAFESMHRRALEAESAKKTAEESAGQLQARLDDAQQSLRSMREEKAKTDSTVEVLSRQRAELEDSQKSMEEQMTELLGKIEMFAVEMRTAEVERMNKLITMHDRRSARHLTQVGFAIWKAAGQKPKQVHPPKSADTAGTITTPEDASDASILDHWSREFGKQMKLVGGHKAVKVPAQDMIHTQITAEIGQIANEMGLASEDLLQSSPAASVDLDDVSARSPRQAWSGRSPSARKSSPSPVARPIRHTPPRTARVTPSKAAARSLDYSDGNDITVMVGKENNGSELRPAPMRPKVVPTRSPSGSNKESLLMKQVAYFNARSPSAAQK